MYITNLSLEYAVIKLSVSLALQNFINGIIRVYIHSYYILY